MGKFLENFATGFTNKLAEGIDERTRISREYFNSQYELAIKEGLPAYKKVQSDVANSTKLAKQLQQMGVPKNIIMAVASQDPYGGLNFLYEGVMDAKGKNVPINEDFFNAFVDISKDFQEPNEDFQTFFSRVMTPVTQLAQDNPEALNSDIKGGFLAALFNSDPHARARKKLSETNVIGDMSVTDLMGYVDAQPAGVDNPPTVTYNPEALPQQVKEMSRSDKDSLRKAFEDEFTKLWPSATDEGLSREEVKQRVFDNLAPLYADDPAATNFLYTLLGETTEEPPEPATEPVVTPEATTPPETPTAPVEAPAEPAEGTPPVEAPAQETGEYLSDEILPGMEEFYVIVVEDPEVGRDLTLNWIGNTPDGNLMYVDDFGNKFEISPDKLKSNYGQ